MKQFKEKSYLVVMGVLAIIIAYIVWCSFFNSYETGKYHYSVKVIGIAVVFVELLLILSYKKFQNCSKKVLNFIGLTSVLLLFAIQIWIVLDIRPIVVSDLANVYAEAIHMVQNNGEISSTGYFSSYSHQIPFLLLLYQLFRLSNFVGITNYAVVGGIFNSILITASVVLGYLTLEKLKGKSVATFFLVTCVFNPVLYFYVPYFYSDTFCIPFIMGVVYLTVLASQQDCKNSKKYVFYFFLGILLAIGFKIRATVLITGVAVVIYLFLKEKFLDFLKYIMIIGIGLALAVGGYKSCQSHYVKFDTEANMYPWSHYVMMGVKGQGTWNVDDWKYTHSFATKEAKVDGNLKEIKERISEMGPVGVVKLLKNKIRLTWSSGTHAYRMYIKTSNNHSVAYKYMVEQDKVFSYWCQIYQCIMMGMLLLGLLSQIKSRRVDVFGLMFISLFGAILFYSFWEVRPRYSVFMILILNMLMVIGQEVIYRIENVKQIRIPVILKNANHKFSNYILKSEVRKKVIFAGGIFLAVLSSVLFLINISKYAVKTREVFQYSVNQQMAKGDLVSKIVAGDIFKQTFSTDREFCYMKIKFVNRNENVTASYQIKLLDDEKTVLYETTIVPDDLDEYGYVYMVFDSVKPQGEETYSIEISTDSATEENYLGVAGCSFGEGHHIVKGGESILNGVVRNGDLAFMVYDTEEKPYFTVFGYVLIASILVGIEILILYLYYRVYIRKDEKYESIRAGNN